MRFAACCALAWIAACSPFGAGAFHCETDAECAGGPSPGRCQPTTGFCSFIDGACDSGQRYGTSSGSLANVCVGDEPLVIDSPAGGEPLVDGPPDAPPDAPPVPVTADYPSVADTFLASDVPTMNFNAQTSALADGDIQRVVLIRFDLAAVPAQASITSAALHIWTDFDPGQACTFYPVLESWDEATTTWNVRTTGTAWATAGAQPPSRSTIAAGSVVPITAGTEYVVAITPAVVAAWVATPGTNFGLAIVTTDADGTRFSTREHPTTTVRPYLRVTHTP